MSESYPSPDPAPYFQPSGKAHRALQALSTAPRVTMIDLRRLCGINPKSGNARRKFWYALQCLIDNGHIDDVSTRDAQAYALSRDGAHLLRRLDNGESVYGQPPAVARVRYGSGVR